ncbi:MAG: chromate efflux transporter, partial [Verrucomicrobiota bacterium]
MKIWLEIFFQFLKLGLTSFGGPSAHMAYFRECFVEKRKWLSEEDYASLMALCQFLPGPGSSQVGMGIGWTRGGIGGSLAAFLGFTLPSAVLMAVFGWAVISFSGTGDLAQQGWIRGLGIAVVVVVAQAVWSMRQALCPDKTTHVIALAAAAAFVLGRDWPWTQIAIIASGAVLGGVLLKKNHELIVSTPRVNTINSASRIFAIACFGIFLALLLGWPLVEKTCDCRVIESFGAMYRSGALVFGGGHVVLPLLSGEVVDSGWVSAEHFAAGYGGAQAVPGPVFTISAFLGAVIESPLALPLLTLVCVIGIFLPGWLLVMG